MNVRRRVIKKVSRVAMFAYTNVTIVVVATQ